MVIFKRSLGGQSGSDWLIAAYVKDMEMALSMVKWW
tara:strand:+ start:457 stop:564 length:108 start_codon:yes stop_codon:yes gene_type:complete